MNPCYQCSNLTSDECKTESMKGFGLCGPCEVTRRIRLGRDVSAPRNSKGGFFGADSKAATIHRESFAFSLYRAARGTYLRDFEANHGWQPTFVEVEARVQF